MPEIEIRTYVFDSATKGYRPVRPGEWPCPVCHLLDGFHDRESHRERAVVPREVLKAKDWQKVVDD